MPIGAVGADNNLVDILDCQKACPYDYPFIWAFGENFNGVIDKKIYITGKENGETIQLAITLTCPKNNVEKVSNAPVDMTEFTQEELDIIERLKKSL
jgi:hypothetical protein